MNPPTIANGPALNLTTVGIAIVALAIVAILVRYSVTRRRRHESLRAQYGSEYDRTVAASTSRRAAEAELVKREERVERLRILPLTAVQRDLFAQKWHDVQDMFVDNPGRAVSNADTLVADVMRARGYPITDFEQRAADLSVDHATFVQNYRDARDVADRNRRSAATTEELRRAMVNYREMFEDLLQDEGTATDRAVTRGVERDVPLAGEARRVRGDGRVPPPPIAPPGSDPEAR